MRHPSSVSRRHFLTTATTLGGAAIASPSLLRAASPNDRLRVAFIGSGGRGARNMTTMAKTGLIDVVALCDVAADALDLAGRQHPKASKYVDFRKLFDAEAKNIDAVVVSTTEHTHAYATLPALQLGKHVYCEKPLAYNIDETRRLTEAAESAGVVTQMGTQNHARPNYHRVVELIQSGAIGQVDEVHVWVSRAWGLQSKEEAEEHDKLYVAERPKEAMPVPRGLDWDLWLGPAPKRPYHDVYYPGPKWYRWWDFANGTMSDLGSHWNDMPYWALQLDAPQTIEAFGIEPHPEIAPASMTAVYQYGARGDDLPPVQLSWYQGTHKPEIWKRGEIPQWPNGCLFIGSNGMLLADYRQHVLLPEEQFADFERPEPFISDKYDHHEEFLRACRGETETGSPFSYAGPLTEANHLGNVAYRAGKKIQWDPKQMKTPGVPETEPFIRREPRGDWSLG